MGGKAHRDTRLVQLLPVVLQSCECEVVRREGGVLRGRWSPTLYLGSLGFPQRFQIRVLRPPGSCGGRDPPVYLCRKPTATGGFIHFAPEAAAAQHWPRDQLHGAWTGLAAVETAGTEVSTAPRDR